MVTIMMTTNSLLAETETLATKNYVDQGLLYVYGKVVDKDAELQDQIDDLKETVNTTTEAGLAERVEELEENQLNAGVGITIDVNETSQKKEIKVQGLEATKDENNKDKIYVYQGGVLTELPTVNNWNGTN